MLRTRLTDVLGIEHPVMLAGMGGVSYQRLAAAVSEAGGFGCLGASTMSTEQLVDEINGIKELTEKPFGVDLLTAVPADLVVQTEKAIEGGMSVFVAGLGVPVDVIRLCHDHNVLVANMCGKVRHAISAVEAGCDLVVAQGTEAGGHTGKVATLALVPQIVDAVGDRVPVVAAGGIVDGRGLAAALALGADGVWVGTRFVATPEARTWGGYKEALVRTAGDGTAVSRAFTGKTLRAVRNKWIDDHEANPETIRPFPEQLLYSTKRGAFPLLGEADAEVDPDVACYPAGQGTGAIDEIVPAGELVERFVAEAEATLSRLDRLSTPG